MPKILTIKDMQKIARSWGGRCLSKKYVDHYTPLKWRCKKGHVWKAAPHTIKQERWCPFCSRYKITIKDLQKRARARGGRCLTREYKGNKTWAKWQCKEGHVWYAKVDGVMRNVRPTWCMLCSRNRRKSKRSP
jgi:hypothetical protein